MVSNGCKCHAERFGVRNRRLFITRQEISPRQLNRRKNIFLKKSLSPAVTISEKIRLSAIHSKMVSNGCKCSPERFGGRNRSLFITGKEIRSRQLNQQKNIFLKKSLSPGVTISERIRVSAIHSKMVPNGCKCHAESFGDRNRRLFIKGQEISPRKLNQRKNIFLKISLSPGITISEKIRLSATHSKMLSNGCKCSPERFGGRNRSLFIRGQEIRPRQLNWRKNIFLKKSLSPGVTISEKM
ncbi:Hypothetical predicted protein [Podarcis lilfordi]|uniref:Uncharacterized protein n=1 Tax=Podarcis lilfordi TaxID=74358 RepID=A0AA35QQJ9_9SAUR|nr:Hypothetical predicted protein [Podarcis lilfordi]